MVHRQIMNKNKFSNKIANSVLEGNCAVLKWIVLYIHNFNRSWSIMFRKINSEDKPSVNKVVLMVVDALRYDFISTEQVVKDMPYVASLLNQSKGCLFPCRVHLPTVTMPRIKVMQHFLKLLLNISCLCENICFFLIKDHDSGKRFKFCRYSIEFRQ